MLFQSRITRRFLASFLLASLTALTITGLFLLQYFHSYTMQKEQEALVLNAQIIEQTLAAQKQQDSRQFASLLQQLSDNTGLRITILSVDGTVLMDTSEPAAKLDNHFERQEVQQALAHEYGTAVRYSDTLLENRMYVAIPVYEDGKLIRIIRTSNSLAAAEASYQTLEHALITAILLAAAVAFLLAVWLAKRQVTTLERLRADAAIIAHGNYSHRINWRSGDEFDQLIQTINLLTENLSRTLGETKAEAEKLALVLAQMDNAVMLIDSQGRIIETNRQAQELFQLKQQALNRHSIHLLGSAEISEAAQRVSHTQQPETITYQRADKTAAGTSHTFTIFLTPFPNKDAAQILAVFHDISLLQEINERQAEFISNAAHELGTPLTAISGFAETLLDDDFQQPARTHHFAQVIYDQSQRMNHLIQDLLQLARLETLSHNRELALTPVPVLPALRSALSELQPVFHEKQQTVQFPSAEDVTLNDMQIAAVPELFTQIIRNLLENASKYTPAGGTISITLDAEPQSITIRITDNGIGIAPEHLPRIFDRFYRIDKARSRSTGGNGIGLSLVRYLTELFHGSIEVESTLGQGTVFILHFPCLNSKS
ncbi:ATP-binding protein [Selenomonas ruminis]|uniref:histidine kinase n=1 Tax=Selenomonas ruminis TaxID=2593411 RepID=A0A5D6WDU6_9FIRM|nr:ATP-binding protein [Selenomonas sp. mPRGC5]TYZ24998.1 HAMP domain-containing protein [Selenomonas sp. mPRGC5]